MPNLKEVRNRIESVRSTEQITNAMKMVAASKLRKAQEAILQLRPYSIKLNEIIDNICANLYTGIEHPYSERDEEPKKALIVAISSNKGLCGTFNTNIIKKVSEVINEELKDFYNNNNLDIICVGKKVHEHLLKRKMPVIEEYNHLFSDLSFENVSTLAEMVMTGYRESRWDRIIIVYNHFKNAANQFVVKENFLPIKTPCSKEDDHFELDYIFEPEKEELLREVIPQALKTQFFRAHLDSHASEHGARMTAMHQATDNAKEMLKELRLAYNKARQATITREIIEIVSGAEALNA